MAGDLINSLLAESSSKIYPVDSEHSAIAQCLLGEDTAKVRRLLITASGGPFRTRSAAEMENATAADALKHPNWRMGAKITVDSATMMNKAFEIIEAHFLFGIAPEKIEAVVHPQSVVHSMVEFTDGAIKAQLGIPDMHLPIAYALGAHTRLENASAPLSLQSLNGLTFEAPDAGRFPCAISRTHCTRTPRQHGLRDKRRQRDCCRSLPFQGRIPFGRIYPIIASTLEKIPFVASPTLDDDYI